MAHAAFEIVLAQVARTAVSHRVTVLRDPTEAEDVSKKGHGAQARLEDRY
jgi:hypothetical protein